MVGKDPYKFIFVHAPKTAGNSIQHVLSEYSIDKIEDMDEMWRCNKTGIMHNFEVLNTISPNSGKHCPISTYKEQWKEELGDFDDYLKFGVTRNPWERAISFYIYKFQNEVYRDENGEFKINVITEKFVNDTELPTLFDCYSVDGGFAMDLYIEMDNLQDDFNYICSALGIPETKLHSLNATFNFSVDNKDKYKKYYNQEMIDAVAERYRKDIEYFGYSF